MAKKGELILVHQIANYLLCVLFKHEGINKVLLCCLVIHKLFLGTNVVAMTN